MRKLIFIAFTLIGLNAQTAIDSYIDYPYTESFTFRQNNSDEANPDIVMKPGYYKIHTTAWNMQGAFNEYPYLSDYDGLEFDLDITLFGSKFIAKTKMSGITGEKHDQLKLLVGVPVRVKIYDGKTRQLIDPTIQILTSIITLFAPRR